jgi:hypothetical protein
MNKRKIKGGGGARTLVLASHAAGKVIPVRLRLYADEEGRKVVANHLTAPFSPTDGGALRPAARETIAITADELRQMPIVAQCDMCGVVMRTDKEMLASVVGTKVHCTSCGTETDAEELTEDDIDMSAGAVEDDDYNNEDDNDDDDDEQTVQVEDEEDEEDASTNPDTNHTDDDEEDEADPDPFPRDGGDYDNSDEGAADAVFEDEEASDAEDSEEDLEVVDVGDDEDDGPDSDPYADDEGVTAGDDDSDDDDDCSSDGDGGGAEEDDGGTYEDDVTDTEATAVLEYDVLEANTDAVLAGAKLELLPGRDDDDRPFYHVMANETPVARMNSHMASKSIQSIFANKSALTRALTTAFATDTQSEVAKAFGLESIVLQVDIGQHTQRAIKREVAKARRAAETASASTGQTMRQCVSTAMAGVTKGVIKVGNPLLEGFVEELSSLGVANARRVVNKVFREHADDFVSTVMTAAESLRGESVDARNAKAQLITEASFQSSHDDEDDEADVFARRLEESNVHISASFDREHSQVATTVGRDSNKFAGLVNGLGTSRRSK